MNTNTRTDAVATIRREARSAIQTLQAAYHHLCASPSAIEAGGVFADVDTYRRLSQAMDRVDNACRHAVTTSHTEATL